VQASKCCEKPLTGEKKVRAAHRILLNSPALSVTATYGSRPAITLASTADLANFLDTNCDSWRVTLFDRDILAELETANYPAELSNYVGIEHTV
jgi:hypothetical protein